MTRAVRTNNRRWRASGFTLMEIVIVLAIAAVLMGGAAGLMIYSSDERELRNLSGQVEALAKRARMSAILHQTSYALEFSESGIRMMPWAQASAALESPSLTHRDQRGAQDASGIADDATVSPSDGAVISVMRWNTDKWIPITKDEVQIWRFDSDGLCEPISVQYVIGDSYLRDTFHPLTASISDTELEAK